MDLLTKNTIYLNPKTRLKLMEEAVKERRSLSQQVNHIIDKYLKGGKDESNN